MLTLYFISKEKSLQNTFLDKKFAHSTKDMTVHLYIYH